MNNIFKKNVNSASVFSSSSDIWNVNGKKCIYTSLFFALSKYIPLLYKLKAVQQNKNTMYRILRTEQFSSMSQRRAVEDMPYCKSIWALCLKLEHLNILPEIRAVKEALSQVFCQDFFLYVYRTHLGSWAVKENFANKFVYAQLFQF